MNFDEYKMKSLRTMDLSLGKKEAIIELCLGLAGETGEIVDYMKKVYFHGVECNEEHLLLECGDLMWYFAMLVHYFDFSFEEILEKNIEKLLNRYPKGFEKNKSRKDTDSLLQENIKLKKDNEKLRNDYYTVVDKLADLQEVYRKLKSDRQV